MRQIWDYLVLNRDTIAENLLDHVWLALVPVVIAFFLSLPLGWLANRSRVLARVLLTGSSVLYTIPSLALILIIPLIIGSSLLSPLNVVIALTLYSLALLVRTTADGLASVPPEVIASADAMGYRPARRWFSVELPLAMPVILAGVRVATVANVSMVSIAALIGIGGLGQLFTRGFQLDFYLPPIIIGLVLSVLLAVLCDLVIVLIQRRLTPWTRAVAAR
ncbi:ABC transporter permease [Nocardioides rotundus]|uniref:ABC transporter permease n=1 Tax=Nocardioides rotundus TaxID=1774216 RepID=UPI002958B43E|nr:ABC transporter permease [Nocardioides rotundus]